MDEMKQPIDAAIEYYRFLAKKANLAGNHYLCSSYLKTVKNLQEKKEYIARNNSAWVDVTSLGDSEPVYIRNEPDPWQVRPFPVHESALKAFNQISQVLSEDEKRKRQKELDSYNQIYGRNRATYEGNYLSWRKEFEATGAEFAKERMLEAYKNGDEEAWERSLRPAKSARTGISIWRDTPLLYTLGAMIALVLCVLVMFL